MAVQSQDTVCNPHFAVPCEPERGPERDAMSALRRRGIEAEPPTVTQSDRDRGSRSSGSNWAVSGGKVVAGFDATRHPHPVRTGVALMSGAEAAGSDRGPLADLRVIDMSTVLAGPNCARYLADFGADVIKVERPGGDSLRNMAWRDPRDGEGLWWKLVNRNKRTIVLDIKDHADREVLLALVDDAHVLVENSRPGTLERLDLGPDVLLARNPSLVITRVSGFGQDGPYASRAGFATIAEAMSGLVALSGEPDGQPLPPPVALTDEVTGLAAAFATMVAVHSGVGQVVDVNLLETMFQMMGPLVSLFGVTGEQQPRLGAGLPYTVPRGTYRCRDGLWVAASTSSDSVAVRVMELLGVGDDPRFTTFAGRTEHRLALEKIMTDWCAQRSRDDVIDAFTAADAAIGPVLDMADIAVDPHYAHRGVIERIDDTPMQSVIARLSATPGKLRWSGRQLDADGAEIRKTGWSTPALRGLTPTGHDGSTSPVSRGQTPTRHDGETQGSDP
jgi:crotonobetainyl-CoA:carnitine CoA-transferase CaiB-like acyl-CoA transferase